MKREYFIINTIVTEIVERINYGYRFKTVFKCKSKYKKPRLCIIWSNPNINTGDRIEMKGFFAKSVFIAQSLYIQK